MTPIRVLSVASEIFPLVKTGGLADVVGALPGALARENVETRTLVPGYPGVMRALEAPETAREYAEFFGGPARILVGKAAGLDLFVIDAPHLYDRPGNPYIGPDRLDWPDNAQRFAALARLGADIGRGAVAGYVADVVHGHDWQAALAPAYLNYDGGDRPGTVITIHNLAFQGIFAASTRESIGLPPRAMSIDGVEYYGGIGYLKAGIRLADRITTVSPTYAREIMTPEFGMALEGLLLSRARDVEGIVNGIDDSVWNPAADPSLPHNYTAFRIDQRAGNRAALETRFGLAPNPDAPIFAVVSRLTTQKGLDLLLQALPLIIEQGGRLAVLGTGEAWIQDGFALAAQSNPGAVGFVMGYDEALAHVIQAGTDFLLVPSRFEPCGLTQLCALRYGATPIVARVGGLADTIIDANEAALTAGVATGIQFHPPNASELEVALRRAFALFSEAETMRRVRVNGMRADVSWRGPAKRYAAIYRALAARVKA